MVGVDNVDDRSVVFARLRKVFAETGVDTPEPILVSRTGAVVGGELASNAQFRLRTERDPQVKVKILRDMATGLMKQNPSRDRQ